jgi:hypothetical protein
MTLNFRLQENEIRYFSFLENTFDENFTKLINSKKTKNREELVIGYPTEKKYIYNSITIK